MKVRILTKLGRFDIHMKEKGGKKGKIQRVKLKYKEKNKRC